jgi:pyrroline-5-carboxylate reductase
MLLNSTIGFIGGGNMAEAIIKGLLAGGMAPRNIMVSDPVQGRRATLNTTLSVRTTDENNDVASESDIVVLAVKPQVAASALTGLESSVTPQKLVISIMAGISTTFIEESLQNGVRIVRAMPNTPALVQAGATAICAGRRATQDDMMIATELFKLVGTVCTVTERQMDAVTGLSGSGPAYAFSFIEALADAGVKNGLSRDVASGLAVQTVLGSALLMKQTGDHPAVLRDRVTSPGGTTIAALHTLENGRFHGLIMDAVDSAVKRSKDLAGIKLL